MIGRQNLWPDPEALGLVFEILGHTVDAKSFMEANQYGEEFFSLLGANQIDSLDYSEYEGATLVHDMNSPVPENLKERFSVVYDGGTIEHVFNIPQAFKNCMEMVEIGGRFVQVNIANNLMGHGFWQFSPELLFRIFSPENGFETEIVVLHENVPGGSWYAVTDPDRVRQRVELCNNLPVYICTIAKRISNAEIFARPPLQSDYSALWEKSAAAEVAKPAESTFSDIPESSDIQRRFRLTSLIPEPVKSVLRPFRQRFQAPKKRGPFDRSYYKLLSEDRMLRGLINH